MSAGQTHSKKAVSQTEWGFDAIMQGVSQAINVGASSTVGAKLQPSTTIIRLVSTVACFVNFGATSGVVAAPNTSIYLPANTPERFGVNQGSYVAAIEAAASGTLYLTEGG